MPESSYAEMKAKFTNTQDEGLIGTTDLADMVDYIRPSVAIDSFRGADDGVDLVKDVDWDYHDDPWAEPADDNAPDWFFPRSKLAASTASRYSRITGYLRPTSDDAGYKYRASSVRLFDLRWSFKGRSSHSMHGAVSTYVGPNWGDSTRYDSVPFDTLWEIDPETELYPITVSGATHLMLSPDDEVRLRFEYFGMSEAVIMVYTFPDAVLTETPTPADDPNPVGFSVTVEHMTISMTSLGVVESPVDTKTDGGVVLPSIDPANYGNIFADTQWKSRGVPEYLIGN